MSHRAVAISMVWAMLALAVVGVLAGAAMHLGLGPTMQMFSVRTYGQVFTIHGAVMLVALALEGWLWVRAAQSGETARTLTSS
jgi:heme/copper-type cytochrome/quinol oxidase subunit 1